MWRGGWCFVVFLKKKWPKPARQHPPFWWRGGGQVAAGGVFDSVQATELGAPQLALSLGVSTTLGLTAGKPRLAQHRVTWAMPTRAERHSPKKSLTSTKKTLDCWLICISKLE
jgi:hypothetical protein